MTSNGIAITPSHPPTVQARGGWGGGFVLGVVLGDVVDVAAWGIVPCVSKIYTLGDGGGGFCVVGLSCGDVDSCQDDPQYKLMKYLVFGTILSSPKIPNVCVYYCRTYYKTYYKGPGVRGESSGFLCVSRFFFVF